MAHPNTNTTLSHGSLLSNGTFPKYANGTKMFLTDPLTPFKIRILCSLDTCDLLLSFYDYRPSIAINTLFIILFSLTGFMHLTQLLFWRAKPHRFFTICISVGCAVEIIGYISRILGNENPFALGPYFVQFIGLTIAPAFFSASIYGTLGQIINSLGPQFSRLRPEIYTRVFVGSDIASLVLQAAGGLTTLGLLLTGKDGQSQTGINIMLVGLGYQILSLIVFIFLGVEWAWRLNAFNSARGVSVFAASGGGKLMVFVVMFCISIFCIFARCCYRLAELSGGLFGHLLRDEVLFVLLESMLISISVFALNLGHPGMLPKPSILGLDLDGGKDLEKPLPRLRVTPPSDTQSTNDSQEDLIIQATPSTHPRKQYRTSRHLSPGKRLSRLSPFDFTRRRNVSPGDAWPLRSRSRNAQRLSADSVSDIYTMYHGKDGWGDDLEKVPSRGSASDKMQVVNIQDQGGSPGFTIQVTFPGQRPQFI